MATPQNGLSACANTCLSKEPFPICAKGDKQCRCNNGLSIQDSMVQCVRATCNAEDQKTFGNGDVMKNMYCEGTATVTSSVSETIFVTATAEMKRGPTSTTSEPTPESTNTGASKVEEPTTMAASSPAAQTTESIRTAISTSTATTSSTPAPSSSGLPKGTLVGISATALLLLAVIAFVLYFFLRRRHQQQNRHWKSSYDGSTLSGSKSHPPTMPPTNAVLPVISNKTGHPLELKLSLPELMTQEEHFKAEVRRSSPRLATFRYTTNSGTPVAELDCSLPPTTSNRALEVAHRNNHSVYYFRPESTFSTQLRPEAEQRGKVNGQLTPPQMKEMWDERVKKIERSERNGSVTLRPSMTGPLMGPWEVFPSIRGKTQKGMI